MPQQFKVGDKVIFVGMLSEHPATIRPYPSRHRQHNTGEEWCWIRLDGSGDEGDVMARNLRMVKPAAPPAPFTSNELGDFPKRGDAI